MKYNEMQMNIIFEKYIKFVDDLPYSYIDNIKNLLYIIVPAFMLKYGLDNERTILNTFRDVRILIKEGSNKRVQAFYKSVPVKDNNITLHKFIVLQNYHDNSLVELLDNLVHEYNHALNSENNEISYNENMVLIRTGLSYIKYDKDTLDFISKDNNYILEEILNTKETEEIINIIHSFMKYKFDNKKISTALYFIDNHIKDKYSSESYKLETFFTKELTSNRTFMATLSKLRIKGSIEDIEYWFDNIAGIQGSYKKLVNIIVELTDIKNKEPKWIFGKNKWKRHINELYKNALSIINTFNNNCNYK